MRSRGRRGIALVSAALAAFTTPVSAQVGVNPTDAVSTAYQTVENHFQLPSGRQWGAISAIEIARDGRSVWIAERCGGNSDCPSKPTLELLLTLGTPGGARDPGFLYQPNDIVVAKDGTIFVAEGHGSGGRVLKFDPTARPLGQFGRSGAGPCIDGNDMLYVADSESSAERNGAT